MKLSFFSLLAVVSLCCVGGGQVRAQGVVSTPPGRTAHGQETVFRGTVFFVERVMLPPDARLHVSLVGRVAGAEYLPLATGVFEARAGRTPFELRLPPDFAASGPLRVQAWIVAGGRLWMQSSEDQAVVSSLRETPVIRMRMGRAPFGEEEMGAGRFLPSMTTPSLHWETLGPRMSVLRGTVSRSDNRALAPDARMEILVEDASRADAPAPVLALLSFSLRAEPFPTHWELPFNFALISPGMRAGLRIRVMEGEKLCYITTEWTPVTRENISRPVSARLFPVGTTR